MSLPEIPENIAWAILTVPTMNKFEREYQYPFTDIGTQARHIEPSWPILPNPRGGHLFLNYEDARMVLEDSGLAAGKVVPVLFKSVVAKKQPSSPIFVGRYVRIDLSGFEFEQEYQGVNGTKTWLLAEMKDYDGKTFRIEDMTKGDVAIICGYEWLTQWLVPVASPEHDFQELQVGDRVRINFPKEHLLKGGNDSGIGINEHMKKRQGDFATIEKGVERVGKSSAFRLKFDKRHGHDEHWLWCSKWLEKA